MADFQYKTYSVGVEVTHEELAKARTVAVPEPWHRRALIGLGLAKQRYRTLTVEDMFYQDRAARVKQFSGLSDLFETK